MSDSWWSHGLKPTRLLCPWDFPGKNTGVGCHFFLQGMNPSPALAGGFFTIEPPGKPQQDLCNTLNNGAKRSCSEMELFHHLWNVFDPRALLLCELPYIWGSPEYSLERKWKWKLLSCVWLFVTPWTIHTVHGILQARILGWIAFPFSRGSSQPRDWIHISRIAGGFCASWATREAQEYWSM